MVSSIEKDGYESEIELDERDEIFEAKSEYGLVHADEDEDSHKHTESERPACQSEYDNVGAQESEEENEDEEKKEDEEKQVSPLKKV